MRLTLFFLLLTKAYAAEESIFDALLNEHSIHRFGLSLVESFADKSPADRSLASAHLRKLADMIDDTHLELYNNSDSDLETSSTDSDEDSEYSEYSEDQFLEQVFQSYSTNLKIEKIPNGIILECRSNSQLASQEVLSAAVKAFKISRED